MRLDIKDFEGALELCAAGVLADVRRVGLPPLGEDAELEFAFEAAAGAGVFTLSVGAIAASDIRVRKGEALEIFYAHLRDEDPAHFAETQVAWTAQPELAAAWAIGSVLIDPHRLAMTHPYVETVGFSFLCLRGGEPVGRLALIGESDILLAADMSDPTLAPYQLETL
ncbi:MAG: hypothetical protein ABWZ40_07955 [Caulobacterales bacterium]